MIKIEIFDGIDCWIYVHDKGEQYFLHYDFWPTAQIKHLVKKEDEIMDILVQKEIKKSDENCKKDEGYFYFGRSIIVKITTPLSQKRISSLNSFLL